MTNYFNPKVISAAVSVVVVVLVVALIELLAIDFITAEMVWSFILGGSVASVGAWGKRDREFQNRNGESG